MYDIVCLSHLRWDFVFQRPQHLMSRFSKRHRVYFIEEPRPTDQPSHVTSYPGGLNVEVLTPMLTKGLSREKADETQAALIERALADREVEKYVLWFYTPMPVRVARALDPMAIVYDCMDELSAFKGASPE